MKNARNKRKINIPVFVSHQGCPNDCVFCNQKKITGVKETQREEAIRNKIASFLFTSAKDSEIEISYFGGSFTGIPFEEQEMYLKTAEEFFSDPRVTGIRISTRPDYISRDILDNLKNHGVTTIELGVQSMDDRVLYLNKRGLKAKDTVNAVMLIREYDFSLGLQMMTGMYGSSREKDIETAKEIIALKPDFVRIYPTVVIEETELYELYKSGAYRPQSLEDAVDLCALLLKEFESVNIPVIRLGLMAGEDINEKKVHGPYHSSFRELAESKIIYDEIKKEITPGTALEIRVNRKYRSKVAGNKKSNILKLKREFNLPSVELIEDNDIETYEVVK